MEGWCGGSTDTISFIQKLNLDHADSPSAPTCLLYTTCRQPQEDVMPGLTCQNKIINIDNTLPFYDLTCSQLMQTQQRENIQPDLQGEIQHVCFLRAWNSFLCMCERCGGFFRAIYSCMLTDCMQSALCLVSTLSVKMLLKTGSLQWKHPVERLQIRQDCALFSL